MDYLLAVVGILTLVVAIMQYRRMPKLKPEPERHTPTCLTIMGVSISHGHDRLGL